MIQAIKDYINSLDWKIKYVGMGFIAGLITPCALSVTFYLVKKIKKVRKQLMKTYVGIQLGGTNYNVAIGSPLFDRHGNLTNFVIKIQKDGRTSDDPNTTIQQIKNFLRQNQPKDSLFGFDFVGIASFGPLCLNQSQNYGKIAMTPKQNWKGFHILKVIQNSVESHHFMIDTDVNAAALAQFKLGTHKCKQSLAYITVGTGVGVGVITQGKTLHGLTHPQGGHIIVKRSKKQYDGFEGVCPYHKDCLEGMVNNISISTRLGLERTELHTLEDTEKIWEIIGDYLGQLCLNLTLTLSPQVIVIGGGLMNRKIIYKYTRDSFLQYLAKYVDHRLFTKENIQQYIKQPKLGHDVGVKGAMILNFAE